MSSLAQPMIAPHEQRDRADDDDRGLGGRRVRRRSRWSGRSGRRPRSPWSPRGSAPTPGSGPPSRRAARTAAAPGRTCRRRPSSSSRPMRGERAPAEAPGGGSKTPANDDGAERGEHQHDRERQADVTDPVDDERLLGRGGRGRLVLPEADQQVRREADALPADEQHEVVVGEHQQQHRRDEQVEVAEEPAPARVVLHVADRVDVDQRADAGDQQHEQRRQLVEQQVHARPGSRRPGSSRTGGR